MELTGKIPIPKERAVVDKNQPWTKFKDFLWLRKKKFERFTVFSDFSPENYEASARLRQI